MLVLTCKPDGVIVAPQNELTVTVISVESDKFRRGVSVPDESDVVREEVWREIGKRDYPPADV